MTTLTHVLAATDLSPAAALALERGFEIAAQSGARFSVLYALGLRDSGLLRAWFAERADPLAARVSADAQQRLEAAVDTLRRLRGISPQLVIDDGRPAPAIERFCRRERVDLLLVGALGEGLVQPLLIGSTTSRLLRNSPCPVLVVRNPATTAYRRALVAIDFSPASIPSIEFARRVAPRADLLVLNAFEVPFEGKLRYAGIADEVIDRYRDEARDASRRELERTARSAGLGEGQASLIALHGPASQVIQECRSRYDCDLVVMGKHGTHATEELLLGSTTRRVLLESAVDLLVYRDGVPTEPR